MQLASMSLTKPEHPDRQDKSQ